jgi:hypothetical protein
MMKKNRKRGRAEKDRIKKRDQDSGIREKI